MSSYPMWVPAPVQLRKLQKSQKGLAAHHDLAEANKILYLSPCQTDKQDQNWGISHGQLVHMVVCGPSLAFVAWSCHSFDFRRNQNLPFNVSGFGVYNNLGSWEIGRMLLAVIQPGIVRISSGRKQSLQEQLKKVVIAEKAIFVFSFLYLYIFFWISVIIFISNSSSFLLSLLLTRKTRKKSASYLITIRGFIWNCYSYTLSSWNSLGCKWSRKDQGSLAFGWYFVVVLLLKHIPSAKTHTGWQGHRKCSTCSPLGMVIPTYTVVMQDQYNLD